MTAGIATVGFATVGFAGIGVTHIATAGFVRNAPPAFEDAPVEVAVETAAGTVALNVGPADIESPDTAVAALAAAGTARTKADPGIAQMPGLASQAVDRLISVDDRSSAHPIRTVRSSLLSLWQLSL